MFSAGPIRLDSMDGQQGLEIEAMVDTGATYTTVPARLLKDLGVLPIDKISLRLAEERPWSRHRGCTRPHRWEEHPHPGGIRRG